MKHPGQGVEPEAKRVPESRGFTRTCMNPTDSMRSSELRSPVSVRSRYKRRNVGNRQSMVRIGGVSARRIIKAVFIFARTPSCVVQKERVSNVCSFGRVCDAAIAYFNVWYTQ